MHGGAVGSAPAIGLRLPRSRPSRDNCASSSHRVTAVGKPRTLNCLSGDCHMSVIYVYSYNCYQAIAYVSICLNKCRLFLLCIQILMLTTYALNNELEHNKQPYLTQLSEDPGIQVSCFYWLKFQCNHLPPLRE